jgi:putative sigma-54 modulation protein
MTDLITVLEILKQEAEAGHFDHVIDVNVILSVEKNRQKAEVTLHVSGRDLFAESDDNDLYAAIDLLVDKLDRQVLKHKDKVQAHPHDALKRRVEDDE